SIKNRILDPFVHFETAAPLAVEWAFKLCPAEPPLLQLLVCSESEEVAVVEVELEGFQSCNQFDRSQLNP
ncbi:Protein of unknown function, partial [Gryllus bimaculatus]